MKKIFVYIGSRKKQGNTVKFTKSVTDRLNPNQYDIEYAFPQDYHIDFHDGNNNMFIDTNYSLKDDLKVLQNKILESDIFIIASPVYIHSMSADLKLFLERSAWWSHTLRLQGKPVIVMSTCSSNGVKTVIEPLSKVITFMGGNVIATANATQIPDRLNDKKWINEVTEEIVERIKKYSKLPNQSNKFLEKVFLGSKMNIKGQEELEKEEEVKLGELEFWRDTGMINFDSFQEYLKNKFGK